MQEVAATDGLFSFNHTLDSALMMTSTNYIDFPNLCCLGGKTKGMPSLFSPYSDKSACDGTHANSNSNCNLSY